MIRGFHPPQPVVRMFRYTPHRPDPRIAVQATLKSETKSANHVTGPLADVSTMTHSIKCPNCTAPIEFETGNAFAVRCPYCGMSTPIPEALREQSSARGTMRLSDADVAQIAALIGARRRMEAIQLIQRSANVDFKTASRVHDAMRTGDATALNLLMHGAEEDRAIVRVRSSSCLASLVIWGIGLAIVAVVLATGLPNLVNSAWLRSLASMAPVSVGERIETVVDAAVPPFLGLAFQDNVMLVENDSEQPDLVAVALDVQSSSSLLAYVDTAGSSVRWRSEVDAQSSFIVTDDAVYAATKSRLRAIDRASGATRWEALLNDEVSRTCDDCILASSMRIYVLSNDAEVQAFDVVSGRKIWSATLAKTAPRIAAWGDRLLVFDRDEDHQPYAAARVRVFDADGESSAGFHPQCDTAQTKNSAGGQEFARPDSAMYVDAAEDALYVWLGGFSSCVLKYALTDGTLLWSAQVDVRTEDARATQFLRSGGVLYIVGDQSILSVDATSGKTRVLYQLDEDHDGMVLHGESAGALILHTTKTRGTRRYELLAVDTQTGQLRWTMKFDEDGGPFTLENDFSGLLSNSEEESAWTTLVTPSSVHLLRIMSKPFRFIFEDVSPETGATAGRTEVPIEGDPLLLGPTLVGRRGETLWVHIDRGFVALDMAAKTIVARVTP
jgi:outer membrane protein assembly factor BamB